MNFTKTITIIAVIAMLITVIPFTMANSTVDSNGNISITDSRGVTTNLTQPATHVASFGAFATNTLVKIGNLSNAVIFDASSAFAKSGIVEVQNYSADKFITVNSASKDAVIQTMLGLVDNSTWNLTTDVILGYGYSSYSAMWSELEGYGFHVVTFYPNSYDGIVQVVEDIETIIGADHGVSEQMAFVKEYIAEVLSDNGITNSSEKVKALYASYSANTLRLGNNNSVTVDFINYAGGVNVAENPSKASPTYAVDFSAIIQLSPEYVLLDGYYTGSAEDFSQLIGDNSITVYKLDKSWNSYCPDAMAGLWTVACLFYPEYFSGNVPTVPVIPDSPTDLSAVASDGYVTLSWTAPVNDGGAEIDYYFIYQNGTLVANSTSTSVNITGLNNGQSYSFMVAAHNSVGNSTNSSAISATPTAAVTAPGVPYGITTDIGDGYVTLSWTAPVNDGGAEIDYYFIYQNGTLVANSTSTSVNITGLNNGQSYSFMVAAHNSVGNSTNSSAISATPTAPVVDDSNNGSDNTTIYLGVGICIIVLAAAAVLVMRKR